jgi:thioredoxin reductase (NADPH)
VSDCLGHSLFYCKDCDGYRVRHKRVGIYGWNNQAVEYALGMLLYSSVVTVLTDGHSASWDQRHDCWIRECRVPVLRQPIRDIRRDGHLIEALKFEDESELCLDALFTTRGDVYFNQIAKELGAKVDENGEILVDEEMRTSVRGLYAAGCVTPSNCQMIIAAGQGAAAAQAISRDLLEESLATKSLRRLRSRQLRSRPVWRAANV